MAASTPPLPIPSQPFDDWQRATKAFRAAEASGASHHEVVQLAEAVIRTRNALTLDRAQAGWRPPDDVLRHLMGDELLLTQRDDSTVPKPRRTPVQPKSGTRLPKPGPTDTQSISIC